jgi:excisionase family DNA binding protein
MAVHNATPYDHERSESDRLLTINDVAFRLAISRDTVYRLVRSGELIPVRAGERLRFRVSDLEDYLERGREQGP